MAVDKSIEASSPSQKGPGDCRATGEYHVRGEEPGGKTGLTLRRWLCGLLLASAIPLDAASPMTMNVTPSISMAPSTVRIQLRIEPDASNRALLVVVDSGAFYRSSLISLEGENAPRTFSLEYRSLPGGNYAVSGELSDDAGHVRATVNREVVVISQGAE